MSTIEITLTHEPEIYDEEEQFVHYDSSFWVCAERVYQAFPQAENWYEFTVRIQEEPVPPPYKEILIEPRNKHDAEVTVNGKAAGTILDMDLIGLKEKTYYAYITRVQHG